MCGIVGVFSNGLVKEKILSNLKKLEYRGYDSSGIALLLNGKLKIIKASGKIDVLINKCSKVKTDSHIGIGHTRWATHGKPSVANAHPHVSQDGSWAIAHNGIIENFSELKDSLIKKGYSFYSATDTEVVANLLQEEINNYQGGLSVNKNIFCLINVCKELKGSYAFACLNSEEQAIYLAKYNSPLYIAENDSEITVTSACLSDNSYCLNNMEFAKIDSNGITFYNQEFEKITKHKLASFVKGKKEGSKKYHHYMLKEIKEIPTALMDTYKHYSDNVLFHKVAHLFKTCDIVKIIACGTAYHAGLFGSSILRGVINKEVLSFVASEFKYNNPILTPKTLCIFVSQSGETADTIACLKMCKEAGCPTIAITNVPNSTITVFSDIVLPTFAGAEVAVASTKAFNCQIFLFRLLAAYLSNEEEGIEISDLLGEIKKLTNKRYLSFAKKIATKQHVLYFGRREDFYLAQEASLKLREVTYIYSNSQPLGELKHGTLALIDKNSFSIVLLTQRDLIDKVLNNLFQITARGGNVLLITPFEELKQVKGLSCYFIILPDTEKHIEQLAIIPTQLLAYYVSQELLINPDKPRNLAKSVTVE